MTGPSTRIEISWLWALTIEYEIRPLLSVLVANNGKCNESEQNKIIHTTCGKLHCIREQQPSRWLACPGQLKGFGPLRATAHSAQNRPPSARTQGAKRHHRALGSCSVLMSCVSRHKHCPALNIVSPPPRSLYYHNLIVILKNKNLFLTSPTWTAWKRRWS